MASKGKNKSFLRMAVVAWLLVSAFSGILPLECFAQFAQPLGAPQESQFGEPLPPPIGDGSTPMPVNPGDNLAPMPPGSGQADQTGGTNFPNGVGRSRTIVRVYRQTNGGPLGASRGQRQSQEIRPDQLSSEQIQKINGIFGINMLSGEQNLDVQASDSQIEQMQEVLYAWPGHDMANGRKKINKDQPAAGYPRPGRESIYDFQGPLPTVRTFSRYLVMLGVVVATIFMSLAATSVIMGNQYGGSRVIGAASGLILLLMGYTIWKVVQMNTFKANSNQYMKANRPETAEISDGYVDPSSVPQVPTGSRPQPQRSGVPVEPLYGAGRP
jgi:hypothetical protein